MGAGEGGWGVGEGVELLGFVRISWSAEMVWERGGRGGVERIERGLRGGREGMR